MKLEDLRAAQTRERATDGLQELRDSFYGDVANYLEELKERRDAAAAAASDPFGDPEVQELTDKIETAEQVTEAIYERRMGKLVKQASLAAAGMPDDGNGLTAEERDLYEDLVERIETNKSHVLDVISGNAETSHGTEAARDDHADTRSADTSPPGESPAKPPEPESADSSAAAAMGGGMDDDEDSGPDRSADAEPPEAVGDRGTADDAADTDEGGADVDRTTVRVTDDVGEIFGVDERPYSLEAEDVVTLPEENAAPLVEKGAAEELE
ncbi:hypothetical protein [Halobacterium wangiae]|uniref:hypothetical protein n=1 Tax=Halobacterium wangiae TaxID=2902623 RepID=UPI001E4FFBB3|nr:hypothetical protein [Halobacterium wangiae]